MHSQPPKGFFITATDTGMGKTTVTKLLITESKKAGFSAIGCKPVACGVSEAGAGAEEDVLSYEAVNSLQLRREQINPLRFDLPVSPNIAAHSEGYTISVKHLAKQLHRLNCLPVDYIFYEGIGGWQVPLNDKETMVDLVRLLQLPVILVVGIRVGCLNHALLTWEAMVKEAPCVGWIANIMNPSVPAIDEHIATLKQRIGAPFLGTLPFHQEGIIEAHALTLNVIDARLTAA
jgi:dethiobiotin synthetase